MNKSLVAILTVFVLGAASLIFGFSIRSSDLNSNDEQGVEMIEESIDSLSKVLLLSDNEKDNFKAVEISEDSDLMDGSNSFYKDAKVGDISFIFQNRVVIYRPSSDIIINTAPYVGGADFDSSSVEQVDDSKIISPE